MPSYGLYASGLSKTDWMGTLRIRDRLSKVLFDRKLGIRFFFQFFQSLSTILQMANMMDEQGNLPLPLPLSPFSSPKER